MTFWVAGAVVVGGVLTANAAGNAADTQAAATGDAIGEQRRQFDLVRGDTEKYRTVGNEALGQLQTDINTPTTAADVMSDPGYQFGLSQGQTALDRKIASMGGRVSGAALKAASRYGTDYATTGYNAAYQRRQDRLNRLAALSGIGQTATGASAAAGANAANQIGAMTMDNAATQGAAGLAKANVWGNAGNQIAALYGRYANQPAQVQPSSGNWTPGSNDGFYTNPQAGP